MSEDYSGVPGNEEFARAARTSTTLLSWTFGLLVSLFVFVYYVLPYLAPWLVGHLSD
jgi:hypothetical protein